MARAAAQVLLSGCAVALLAAATGAWGQTAVADPAPRVAPPHPAGAAADEATAIIVAVAELPEPAPAIGSTPRGRYAGVAGYAGSTAGAALAAAVAQTHGLTEAAFWSIAPLQIRCMLYRLPPGADRAAALARLAQDPRVQLAQPLNTFETLAAPAPTPVQPPAPAAVAVPVPTSPAAPAATSPRPGYDDPYMQLQHGFTAINALQAQAWSRGERVDVALIDTGTDGSHPDLAGRIAGQRDFAAAAHPQAPGGERHGTEMAGVIAAMANNRIGIVGVAPLARLRSYRACWPLPGSGAGRCDSFTLAQALGAAIADGSDVINLSLGGPADPLLQRLVERAIQQGAIVVGAVPPGGALDGFPAGVPGVLAVAAADDALSNRRVLSAPGRDILTLQPGGSYGYTSGASLAAAHVTGAVALLRSLQPGLRAAVAHDWLAASQPAAAGPIDICQAVRRLRPMAACGKAE